MMMMRSYGDRKSPLRGRNIKDHTVAQDIDDSTNEMVKKATHVFGPYEIRNARGGTLDFAKLNKIFLKGEGFKKPVSMEVAGQVKEYSNYYEVYQDLIKARIPHDEVFEHILDLMEQHPETKSSIITRLDITTSMKQGITGINHDLQGVLNEEVEPVITQVDNAQMGIQLNSRHDVDEEHTIKGMSMITQVTNSSSAGGASTFESTNLFRAVAMLSDYLHDKEYANKSEGEIVQKLLEKYMENDSDDARFLRESMIDGKFNLNNPRVRRIAISQGFAFIEKARIKIKFNGGQYVVRNTNGTNMLYDIPTGEVFEAIPEGASKEKFKRIVREDGSVIFAKYRTMTREQAEKYVHSDGSGLTEDDLINYQRNLKWVDYIDNEGNSITDSEIFQKLNELTAQLEQAQKSGDVQKIDELKAQIKDTRIEYHKLMNSGKYEMIPGEVLLPFSYKKTFKLEGDVVIDEILDDPEYFIDKSPDTYREVHSAFKQAIQGVAARIPGSGKQSGNPFKVVGFYPPEVENTIGIPVESMLVKGEDLDIDKANVMLRSFIPYGSMQGQMFPFMTEAGLNKTNGGQARVLTKEEFAEKNPELFQQLEDEYHNDKYDWYEQGLLNYATIVMGEILGDPRNMIEANTTVNTEDLKKYADDKPIDAYITHLDPAKQVFFNTLNKMGKKMVGIEATAFKAYLAVYHAMQSEINNPNEQTDLAKNKTGQTAFKAQFSKNSILGGPYFDIANTRALEYSLLKKLNSKQLTEFKETLDEEYSRLENEKEAWEWYSQLVNAAADNAKDPILGKLGIDDVTGNLVSAGISMGIPFDNLVQLFENKKVDEIVRYARNKNMSLKKAYNEIYDNIVEKRIEEKGDKGQLTPKEKKSLKRQLTPAVVHDLLQLNNYGEEFSFIGRLLKINGGIPNTEYEYFKVISDINNTLQDTYGIKDFDIIKFLQVPSDQQDYIINQVDHAITKSAASRKKNERQLFINPLKILKGNPHYFAQMKAFVDQMDYITKEVPQAKDAYNMAVQLQTKLGKYGPKITESVFRKLMKLQNAVTTTEFFKQHLPEANAGGRRFDLTTDVGKSEFVRYFPKYFEKLSSNPKYRSNAFIRMLKTSEFVDPISGDRIPYIKPTDPRTLNPRDVMVAQQDLGNIDNTDLEALFAYAHIMNNVLADGVVSFDSFFTQENTELVKKLAKTQKSIEYTEKELQNIANHAEYLIPDLYPLRTGDLSKLRTGSDRSFSHANENSQIIYYRKRPFNEGMEDPSEAKTAASYSKRFQKGIVSISTTKNSMGTFVPDAEEMGFEGSQFKSYNKLHKQLPYPTSKEDPLKNKLTQAKEQSEVEVNSGYEATALAETLALELEDYQIVNPATALITKHKNLIVKRADKLTSSQKQQLKNSGKNTIYIGESTVTTTGTVSKVDVLGNMAKSHEQNMDRESPVHRENQSSNYTSITYSNQDDLTKQYVDSADGIILSENTEKYNHEVREELFGKNPDKFMKQDKLIDKETGIQYEVLRVQPDSETFQTPVGETMSMTGHRLYLKSRDGSKTDIFVPGNNSVIDSQELRDKIDLYFKNQRHNNPEKEPIGEKEYRDKFKLMDEQVDYAFAVAPSDNIYTFDDVYLDEDTLYGIPISNDDRNVRVLDAIKSTHRNLYIHSSKVYPTQDTINQPNKRKRRNIPFLQPLTVDRKVDGAPVQITAMFNLVRTFGSKVKSYNTELIKEDPEITNDFLNYKSFEHDGQIIINTDHTTVDTPVYELSQVWLDKLANGENYLYNDIIDKMLDHDEMGVVREKYPQIEDEQKLAELAFDNIINSLHSRSESPEIEGLINEYLNFVTGQLKTDVQNSLSGYPSNNNKRAISKLKAEMSTTNIARTLKNGDIQLPVTRAMQNTHWVYMEDFHGDGRISEQLNDILMDLITKGEVEYKCDT